MSKTTTAVALAEVAALSVPTVAVHTDPMGSLRRWAELAAEAGHPLRSQVIGLPVADLGHELPTAARAVACTTPTGSPAPRGLREPAATA